MGYVLIQNKGELPLWGMKLNESRSADWYMVNSEVAGLVAAYNEQQAQTLLHEVIREKNTDLYELDVLQSASYRSNLNRGAWLNAFFTLFGDKAVLTDNSQFLYEKLRAIGKEPIVVTHSGLMSLLKAVGVATPDKILTREQRKWQDLSNASKDTQEVFDRVWARLKFAGLTFGTIKPELGLFTEYPGQSSITFGNYSEGKVFINSAITGSDKERQACLEECAHHISESSDETREFQTFLLEIADHFMFRKKIETIPLIDDIQIIE